MFRTGWWAGKWWAAQWWGSASVTRPVRRVNRPRRAAMVGRAVVGPAGLRMGGAPVLATAKRKARAPAGTAGARVGGIAIECRGVANPSAAEMALILGLLDD